MELTESCLEVYRKKFPKLGFLISFTKFKVIYFENQISISSNNAKNISFNVKLYKQDQQKFQFQLGVFSGTLLFFERKI